MEADLLYIYTYTGNFVAAKGNREVTMGREAFDVLKNRRSIRSYKPEQVADGELDQVLEAGLYAPTAGGRQAAIIVAVQEPGAVAQLNRLNGEALGKPDAQPYYGAPTVIVVLAPADSPTKVEDGSSVLTVMLNAAYAAGLGSCWIHRSKPMFESEEGKELLKKWGLPEDLEGVGSLALGYPAAAHPEAAPRKEGRIVRVR